METGQDLNRSSRQRGTECVAKARPLDRRNLPQAPRRTLHDLLHASAMQGVSILSLVWLGLYENLLNLLCYSLSLWFQLQLAPVLSYRRSRFQAVICCYSCLVWPLVLGDRAFLQ